MVEGALGRQMSASPPLKASDIVAKAAADALPAAIALCPYDEADTYNYQNWQRAYAYPRRHLMRAE
jgi:hypothetical protein